DPHYWLSYTNAALLTANIADVLSNLDPVNADRYEQNAADYAGFLAGERTAALELIAGTQANKNLITLHDAWYYFADDLGLTIVGTFEPTAGEEPTPKALAELAALAKEHGVTAIFGEVELSTASVQNFAQDANLKVGFFDEHGGVEGRMSFAELMRFNVQSILIEAGGL
ncbi:MAG: zinc ABC transporter substrate-binding protein, partial [Candidatus Colwellbacteria bacterium]|nr:zinc ABC transporter substrate-binding protein [Candidatus Colwellbacteria bacterium]